MDLGILEFAHRHPGSSVTVRITTHGIMATKSTENLILVRRDPALLRHPQVLDTPTNPPRIQKPKPFLLIDPKIETQFFIHRIRERIPRTLVILYHTHHVFPSLGKTSATYRQFNPCYIGWSAGKTHLEDYSPYFKTCIRVYCSPHIAAAKSESDMSNDAAKSC